MPTRKLALRRIAALALTPILIALAINATSAASRLSGNFARWQSDRPINLPIDLSHPGTTTAPFRQTCHSAHAETLTLEFPDLDPNAKNPDPLQGLAGTISIFYDNTLITTADLAQAISLDDSAPTRKFQLARFPPFDTGTYTLSLTVTQPAPLLAQHPQQLTAQYLLCGMEKYPELLATFFATCAWLLTLLIAIPALYASFKHGLHANP